MLDLKFVVANTEAVKQNCRNRNAPPDVIDFETGGKVSGTGFYFLKNDAVLLDLALQQFAIRKLSNAGFTPIITPDLARNSILEGIGFTPRGVETQVYSIEDTDLSLV